MLLAQYWTVIAVVFAGALTHALVQVKSARISDRPFDRIDIAIAFAIALFSGLMFSFGGFFFSSDAALVHGTAGLGAFLGLNGLNKIGQLALEGLAKRTGQGEMS